MSSHSNDSMRLRQRAQAHLEAHPKNLDGFGYQKALHELQVHQIELEMQNQELRETQAALTRARDRYFNLFDLAPAPYFLFDAEHRLLDLNLAAAELLDKERSRLKGRAFIPHVAAEHRDLFHDHLNQAFALGRRQTVELHLKTEDGLVRHVLMASLILPAELEAPPCCLTSCVDLTARKRAEADLEALRNRLALDLAAMERLHELSTLMVRQNDLHTFLEPILDSALFITGGEKGSIQLLDHASLELNITAHRGFEPSFVQHFSRIRPDPSAFAPPLLAKRCMVVEEGEANDLSPHQAWACELLRAAGACTLVCTPLLTRAGRLVGVLSIYLARSHQPGDRDLRLLDLLGRQAADFIERTEAEIELRAAQEKLARINTELEQQVQERTAKLQETIEELEQYSYTITHDMRAPLRAMQGFASLMIEDYQTFEQHHCKDYLRRIVEAADRMDRLITDALQFSGALRKPIDLEPVNPEDLLKGILESYPQYQPPRAHVQLKSRLPWVLGNKAAMTQCFSNLLNNAVKFVYSGQTPEIQIWAEPRGEVVRFCFKDNGIGIEKHYFDKIWIMFQRLNRNYEGTGIGLALVHKVVERMGGRVGVESEPGHGSLFWVELKSGEEVMQS